VLGLVEGVHVTHVDASKSAIKWAEQNAELNGVLEKPVRWILEDAVSFVKKEVRRGNKYDIIVMDPPSYGRGAKGEIWKIEEAFLPLMDLVKQLLSDNPVAIIINGYSAGYSSYAYSQNLDDIVAKYGGEIEHSELLIDEESMTRVLPAGIVARWSK
jgi:23S rRNA (cytosine1962-C5)-methyltransferase